MYCFSKSVTLQNYQDYNEYGFANIFEEILTRYHLGLKDNNIQEELIDSRKYDIDINYIFPKYTYNLKIYSLNIKNTNSLNIEISISIKLINHDNYNYDTDNISLFNEINKIFSSEVYKYIRELNNNNYTELMNDIRIDKIACFDN